MANFVYKKMLCQAGFVSGIVFGNLNLMHENVKRSKMLGKVLAVDAVS